MDARRSSPVYARIPYPKAMGHHDEEKKKKKDDDDDEDDGDIPLGRHFAGLYKAGFTDYGGLVAPLPLGVSIGTFFPPLPSDSKLE